MRRHTSLFPIFATLSLAAMLSACAQITPPLPRATRNIPLSDLAHCGQATSAACARIHVALANAYLSNGPLDSTALGNAARELGLAAQNKEVAAKTLPLRRIVHVLQERTATNYACIAELRKTRTQLAATHAQSAAAQARLHRLENLLHDHAEKSLDHHVLKRP
ncbi:hypothetical protein BBC27_12535 [Acidithiobacillus ferrivorans]|uniref:Lipoprotein n=1 Tax=Acidithiobacillus ferrivorans TaxID=160808 RepID=A0A1B9BY21_9PROT|nr:hypothetical protein [Acidithiobacillus ferrivorans]OCB02554.1 hypothetical protein BBC27_12535 [Acidithiobacillus ferrivorans]